MGLCRLFLHTQFFSVTSGMDVEHHNIQETLFYKINSGRIVLTVMCFSTAIQVPSGIVRMLSGGGEAARHFHNFIFHFVDFC